MYHVHIIDADPNRREQIARSIFGLEYHAEIYESFDELRTNCRAKGLIFAGQEEESSVLTAMRGGRCFLPVVFYGETPEIGEVTDVMRAGALDFLVWPVCDRDLARKLQRYISDGEKLQNLLDEHKVAKRRVSSLSKRELQVLRGLVDGGANKSIAVDLGISPRTVEIHRANLMRKLSAKSPANAVRIAIYADMFNIRGIDT